MDYNSPDSLYNLLPAVYRLRDAEEGYPLRAFLRIIAKQVTILKEDIDRLWDNFFIETCDRWVIPYIGDLVANNPLHELESSNRADVAKTIYYRRRKGTLPMLEELARDITGWKCRAVEFFELLNWTQNMNHIRYHSKECPDLRNIDSLSLINTAFDSISHTIDVRNINQIEGWFNIKNIGFFLWRLKSYPLTKIKARRADALGRQYSFSAVGNPAPLFFHAFRESDETGTAQEIHVDGPIRPTAFFLDLEAYKQNLSIGLSAESNFVGLNKSIQIFKDGVEVAPEEIIYKNLKSWDLPPLGKVGVDVSLGRMVFPAGEEPGEVGVSYYTGFSANLGGGLYDRRLYMADKGIAEFVAIVRHNTSNPEEFATITLALGGWIARGKPNTIIQIVDNWTYKETLIIEPRDNKWLVIEAANNTRPILELNGSRNFEITGDHPNASLSLNGFLVEGGIDIQNSLGELKIQHCILIPGISLDQDGNPVYSTTPSVRAVDTNTSLEIEIDFSIVGLLRLPEEMTKLTVRNSILDGLGQTVLARTGTDDKTGPLTVLERVTVLGAFYVSELLLANEVLFTQKVHSDRTQNGCVRFSYVPRGSKTPRRFRCQPDLTLTRKATELGRDLIQSEINHILSIIQPKFTSVHYGHPGYCQLSYFCPNEIKTGAEDGSEMGVFRHLRQPQREANLHIRLGEYLPFGLKPGIIYVT